MRCDSILKRGGGRGMCGLERALNWKGKELYRFRRSHRVLLYKSTIRNDQKPTVIPLGSSRRLGCQASFIALSPGCHL